MDNNRALGLWQVHLAAILFAAVGIIIKSTDIPLIQIGAGRAFFASLVIMILLVLSNQDIKLHNTKDYLFLMALGVIQALQWISFFYAIKISSVAIGLLSLYTFPAFVTLLEPIVFKGKFSWEHMISSFIILGGISFIVPDFNLKSDTHLGVLLGVFSALLVAIPFLIHKKYVSIYSSETITFFKTSVSFVVLVSYALVDDSFNVSSFDINFIWVSCLLGVLFTALPYILFINSLKYLQAQQSSTILTLEVVYGRGFSVVFLHEYPSINTIMGGTIIFLTLVYLTLKSDD